MSFISDMKIAAKVAGLLIILGAVTLGLAILSHRTITSISAQYSSLTETLPASTELARANRRSAEMMYAGYRALARDNAAGMRADAEQVDDAFEAGKRNLDSALKRDPSLAEQTSNFRRRLEGVHSTVARAVQYSLADRKAEAASLLVEADKQVAELAKAYLAFNDARFAAGDRQSAELSAASSSAAFWMFAISVAGVVGVVGASVLISRATIVAPLNRLQATMRRLAGGDSNIEVEGVMRGDEVGAMAKTVLVFRDAAIAQKQAAAERAKAEAEQKFVVDTVSEQLANLSDGDLTADIKVEFPQAYVELRTNFNAALTNLRNLIGSVVESSHGLRTGSGEIAQASEDLARRTESNAASLEETSAALMQIDTRIKATAEAASRTVARADEAISTVSGGRNVADEAVQAMSRVRESAKGIDEVIEGVDKIAFQTRVLAMNAAVEAGRAGDAGRGFAVVADLVSALAMRAEEEAKRARDQLTVTQTDIVTAVEAVQRVDGALAGISEGVGEVHQLLGGMASDNQAQASAITQISVAITNMDQATQQNAAMVEETSAAARNLNSESQGLADKASQFKISAVAKPPKAVMKPSTSIPSYVVKDRSLSSPVKGNGSANGSLAMASADGDWASF